MSYICKCNPRKLSLKAPCLLNTHYKLMNMISINVNYINSLRLMVRRGKAQIFLVLLINFCQNLVPFSQGTRGHSPAPLPYL